MCRKQISERNGEGMSLQRPSEVEMFVHEGLFAAFSRPAVSVALTCVLE